MSMRITQQLVSSADLIVIISRDGAVQWSSHRNPREVVSALRQLAEQIESGLDSTSPGPDSVVEAP